MATDLAEFVGAALALNLVFGVPMLPAGMITEMVAFIVLGLQVRGHRPFERAIAALLLIVTGGFAYELLRIQPSLLGLTSRRVDVRDDAKRRQALSFQRWDVITALGLAGIVNLAMLMVAAKLFHSTGNASVSTLEGRARRAQPTRRRGRCTGVRRRAVGIGVSSSRRQRRPSSRPSRRRRGRRSGSPTAALPKPIRVSPQPSTRTSPPPRPPRSAAPST